MMKGAGEGGSKSERGCRRRGKGRKREYWRGEIEQSKSSKIKSIMSMLKAHNKLSDIRWDDSFQRNSTTNRLCRSFARYS